MPNTEELSMLGVRVTKIEESTSILAELRESVSEIKLRVRELARHDEEHKEGVQRLTENQTKSLAAFENALGTQRDNFQAALERQRREHREAVESQEVRWRVVQDAAENRWRAAQDATEQRWRDMHERVMGEVIESLQSVIARTILGKAFQWILAGAVSLLALFGGWFWARLLK